MSRKTLDELLRTRAQSADDLVTGKCLTYDNYRHEVGYIRGLDEAIELIRKSAPEEDL
jgi:hypothetical protein